MAFDVVESRRMKDFLEQLDRLVKALYQRHRQRGWVKFDYAFTA